MSNIIKVSIFCLSLFTALAAAEQEIGEDKRLHSVRENIDKEAVMEVKEVSVTDNLKHMFKDAKVSGQIRAMYAGYEQKEQNVDNNYATALGGKLKYELAQLQGFNAGVAFYTSHDLNFASGDNTYHNNELSSSDGSYTQTAEAYLNYKYQDFNFRAGRQVLDTPLADSDDIRMISNSFEAYVATYNYNGFEFMAGNIQSWQGYDAGLDTPWEKTGKNGTNFGGVAYNNVWELNLWYYNITDVVNAFYFDGGIEYNINKDILIHAMVQYLDENELALSGYESTIYGAMAEFVSHGVSVGIAYNKSFGTQSKMSFSGFGGGTLFTSMDTLILDDIADDRDTHSLVPSIGYEIQNFSFLYAYGDFKGDADSLGKKAHIIEQDVSLEYNVNDEFLVACVYAMQEDKANSVKTDHDWNRFQLMVNYNF
ncbi:hypothetical protein [Sulfurimonas autotrophica]|uniref:Outer membrane porin n=1 Tax=Sulfurimonas autotrophica (strain ATCC BAA-671 / DSM 16294 / JCM 11897 / OK10) TaxID=563040 RepID=E0UPA8_SULAO|nr:hypothetical protein [Sulfurimonas autotrophica]ADN08572.1 conserved hypothetical protein [Sulfurimonas autotrophica DSM 16294]